MQEITVFFTVCVELPELLRSPTAVNGIKNIDKMIKGMTSQDIRHMSEDELLDMDYFLNEDDFFQDIL